MYSLQGHEGATMCAEFSSTGEYFATGSTDEHVRVTICICSILRIMDISELILPNHISCVSARD